MHLCIQYSGQVSFGKIGEVKPFVKRTNDIFVFGSCVTSVASCNAYDKLFKYKGDLRRTIVNMNVHPI